MESKITWTNERRNGHGVSYELTCEFCGKLFWLKRTSVLRGHGRYCSKECQVNAGSIVKKCEVCGKEFKFKRSHHNMGQGRYCSMKCRTIGFKQRGLYDGEGNSNYKGVDCYSAEYICKASHDRRVKKLNNGGSYTANEWKQLCEKYGNRCLACGKSNISLTVDHIVPISKGGTNDINNLQPLCKSCNSKKNKKIIDYR